MSDPLDDFATPDDFTPTGDAYAAPGDSGLIDDFDNPLTAGTPPVADGGEDGIYVPSESELREALREEQKGELTSRWLPGRAAFSPRQHRRVDLPVGDDMAPASREAIRVLETGFQSPECTELHGLGPDELFTRFRGQPNRLQARFSSEADYNAYVKQLVDEAESIYTWDDVKRMRRAVLRLADGSSLTVIMPPFSPYLHFTVRKNISSSWSWQDLVERGSFTPEMLHFLRAAVRARTNILVVGNMGAGKSSLVGMLSKEFSDLDRVAVVEEIPELQISVPQVAYYTYQPMTEGLGLDDILDSILYARFDRVIVGEVHMEGLTKMLEVMLTGTGGSLSTYHAPSTERALERMRIGIQMENPQMSDSTALALLRNSIELVVVLERFPGQHRCTEIAELDWRSSSGSGGVGRSMIFQWDAQAGGYVVNPPDQGGRLVEKAAKYQVRLENDWFVPPHLRDKVPGGRI